jgi:hypothetical protein
VRPSARESAIVRPVIVLGAPRSGTTIIRNCLALHRDVWHLAGESHEILEGPFHPAAGGYESNRVEAGDVDDGLARALRQAFARGSINLSASGDARGRTAASGGSLVGRVADKVTTRWVGAASKRHRPSEIRFLEKTPKNTLRVPMLERVFPDARYVHITRNAPDNIDSLIEGWRATDRIGPITRQRFARSGYPIARQLGLRDYSAKVWKFALVPDWRDLRGASLADIAARQYFACNRYSLDDLSVIDPSRVRRVRHEDFVREPVATIRELLAWADLPPSVEAERYAGESPRVNSTRSSTGPIDGLRNADAVRAAIASTDGMGPLLADLGDA